MKNVESSPHVTVTVNGRNFRMACDPGQEDHLIGLAGRMNIAIDELRESFGEIGDQRLTVMAAILMTDRLDEAERRIHRLEAELKAAQTERDQAQASQGELEDVFSVKLASAAERIDALAAELSGTSGASEPADSAGVPEAEAGDAAPVRS